MADFVKIAFIQVHGVHGVPVDFMFIAISHSVAACAGHMCVCASVKLESWAGHAPLK